MYLKFILYFCAFFVVVGTTSVSANVFNSIISYIFMPTCQRSDVKFSTVPINLPANVEWRELTFAKELMNIYRKVVVIHGGTRPIPDEQWNSFRPIFPWQKNINRNLLFKKTAFLRSPDKKSDCKDDCVTFTSYRGYTWIEIANPVCIEYYPKRTDFLKPAKGHVAIKTIIKCQAVYFEDFIYQLTDNKGNFYAMHATENGPPTINVDLPAGWTLRRVELSEPLIITPFGGGDNCYFNILGDNLGQGYHQYIFAKASYP